MRYIDLALTSCSSQAQRIDWPNSIGLSLRGIESFMRRTRRPEVGHRPSQMTRDLNFKGHVHTLNYVNINNGKLPHES